MEKLVEYLAGRSAVTVHSEINLLYLCLVLGC